MYASSQFNKTDCGGFTLMEVLVTVVILSIGLLGVAGLQLNSLKGNQDALLRSEAVLQAMDGAERLQDQGGLLAPADIADWRDQVAALLPLGMGVICLDSTPNDGTGDGAYDTDAACDGLNDNGIPVYAVKVWWDHDRDGPPGQQRDDGSTSSSLMRVTMEVSL